eukprot:3991019-Pleurochrysis_carterae.AAC.2
MHGCGGPIPVQPRVQRGLMRTGAALGLSGDELGRVQLNEALGSEGLRGRTRATGVNMRINFGKRAKEVRARGLGMLGKSKG